MAEFQQFRLGDAIQQGQAAAYNNYRLGEATRTMGAQQSLTTALQSGNPTDMTTFEQQYPMEAQRYQQGQLQTETGRANLAHMKLEDNQKVAASLSGAMAAALKDPSDDGIKRAGETFEQETGQPHQTVTDRLLALPVEKRKAALLAYAASNPVGQKAIDLLFPEGETTTSDILQTNKTTTKFRPGISTPASPRPAGATSAGVTPEGVDLTTSGLPPSNVAGYNNLSPGDKALIDNNAKLIATYDKAPLSGFALMKPLGNLIMSRVKEIEPNYDETLYQNKLRTTNAFASGVEGRTVKAFNVGLYHLDTLDKLTEALDNGNLKQVNRFANEYAAQTGNPAPTNFEAAKDIVGNEIVKAIVGAGGTGGDREKAQATLNRANSPEQLKQVINTYQDLMAGQLAGLKQQYEAGSRKQDFEEKYLSPEARAIFRAKNPQGGGQPTGEPTAVNPKTGERLVLRNGQWVKP